MELQSLITHSTYLKNITDFVINSSIDGIRAIDLNYNYTLFNPAMERISGYKKEDVLGRNALELFPFLKAIGEDVLMERSMKGETIYVTEKTYDIPQTGRKGFFEAVHSPLYDTDQRIVGSLKIVRDISEFKRATMALNETQLKLRSLSNVVTDGLITCNSRGDILSWNAGAENIFGFKENEGLRLNLSQILPEFKWQVELRILRSLDNPERTFRIMGLRKNGSSVPVEVSKSPWNLGSEHFLSLGLKDLSDFNHLENQAIEFRELGEALLQIHNDLHEGIVAIDRHTNKVVYANHSFAQMLGYTKDELMKLPESYLTPIREKLENKTHQSAISKFFKVGLTHKSGNLIHIDAASRQIETAHGMISLFILRGHSKGSLLTQLSALE